MIINNMEFTIGADPEIFVEKDNLPHSAHGLVPGTKEQPHPVERGAVQVDGMALEFNIEPAKNGEEFIDNVTAVLDQMIEMVPEYELLTKSSVIFDQDHWRAQPAEAKRLGCEPDFNGHTLETNPKPRGRKFMRTAGGHIHIGGFHTDDPMSPLHFEDAAKLARLMDKHVGVYSILWDGDDDRREMYGQASAFRPKKYGMEYRTLSNSWLFNTKIMQFICQQTTMAILDMFKPDDAYDKKYADIINNSDRSNLFFNNNPRVDQLRSMKVMI